MKKSRLQKKAGFFGAGNVTRTRDRWVFVRGTLVAYFLRYIMS